MGKKSSRELVGDIAGALTKDPQSIQRISDAVEADRQSVTKYLEELEDAGIVDEKNSGRTREFYVSEYEDDETYFELPLKKGEKERFRTLFNKITEKHRERFGEVPGKLMSQRIAVKVIKEMNLDLPFGRYQYGSITAMNFTPNDSNDLVPVDFGPDFSEDEVDEKVDEVVEKYGEIGFREARRKQYDEENMELYLLKEEILELLTGEIEDSSDLERKLYSFLAKTPSLDEESEEALVDFIAVAPELVDNRFNRSQVCTTFEQLWELTAFYCLREDMAEHYNKQIVESRTEKKREEKKQQMEQALGDLISLHEDVVDTPEVDEDFEDLQGSADKISDEEREKRKEELEDMNSSDLSREFGLDS